LIRLDILSTVRSELDASNLLPRSLGHDKFSALSRHGDEPILVELALVILNSARPCSLERKVLLVSSS